MKKRKNLQKPYRQIKSPAKKFVEIHKLDLLEKIALVLGLWFLIFPRPYKELLTILLFIPLLGLILNGLKGRPSFASLFRITTKDDKTQLDLADFIDFPPWVLLLRIFLDFEFDAYKSMVIPGLIACLLVIGFLFITHRGIGQGAEYRKDMYVLAIVNIAVFAIAGALAINCVYDNKPSEQHYTTVISKHVSKGRRSTTYRVKVQPWGHHYDTESIHIDATQYYSLEKGDTVQIDLHKGLLGIPWYHITKPKSSKNF
jgi:hypothetical protein